MAVDGSVIKTLCSLAEAAYLCDKNGKAHSGWRFHTHFAIDRGVPVRMEVTSALNSGKTDEKHRLRLCLESDHCYVLDRWYAEFALWNEIVAKGSSYICRIRDNSNLSEVLEERPVSAAAQTAGLLRDVVVRLDSKDRPNHAVRVILVQTTPHKKTGGRKGRHCCTMLRLASSRSIHRRLDRASQQTLAAPLSTSPTACGAA